MLALLSASPNAWMMTSSQPQVGVQQHALLRQTAPVMVSRRKAEVDKLVDPEKLYEPAEAVKLMKSMATAKFVETAELHGNLNLDPKYNDQQIRTTVALPHGTGKDVRVAVRASAQTGTCSAAHASFMGPFTCAPPVVGVKTQPARSRPGAC